MEFYIHLCDGVFHDMETETAFAYHSGCANVLRLLHPKTTEICRRRKKIFLTIKLKKMNFDTQPVLENERVILHPLREEDFETLFEVASDPKIWEQHPASDRWKRDVFRTFFDRAIQSNGAFRITDKEAGKVVGSTRIYDYNEQEDSVFIGYTFYAVACWGKGINSLVKTTMLNYVFQYVPRVNFYVGADNIRSQMAVERLGAKKIAEREVSYPGEKSRFNFLYQVTKEGRKDYLEV